MTEKSTMSLNYNEPRPWALLNDEMKLVGFSLEGCIRASQDKDPTVAAYASTVLNIITIMNADEEPCLEFDHTKEDTEPTE